MYRWINGFESLNGTYYVIVVTAVNPLAPIDEVLPPRVVCVITVLTGGPVATYVEIIVHC